ncbi:MAG: tetraacyldisaccharide 4'-kinase [Chitinophagales bacterium]|nr:tetraacyldisaccharide 4'-kinase [Chitinophagales bacterium]MDW8428543.1 tetraacyldisaccharide 4'-kinase [Chitinophagales bacterium]
MRRLLWPLASLYGAAVWLHHKQYDWGLRRTVRFDLPTIGIGNLAVGGSGKTPLVEYLLGLLVPHKRVGVLSRGYGRSTRGFRWVMPDASYIQVGDEPLQVKRKFPEVAVAVCEDRVTGIPLMLIDQPELEVIILDDVFQHRAITPGLSLLLTDYHRPYWTDHLLPVGDLREPISAARRADVVLVTKCPENMRADQKAQLWSAAKLDDRQQLLFCSIRYGVPYGLFSGMPLDKSKHDLAILVTGIAKSRLLKDYLEEHYNRIKHFNYVDHYRFKKTDIQRWLKEFQVHKSPNQVILTTEKDAMRLLPYRSLFDQAGTEPFCIPIYVYFEGEQAERFNQLVLSFVATTAEDD